MKMGQAIEVDRSGTGNPANRDYMYYDLPQRTESKRYFKDELTNQTKEIDMSLATLRDFKEQVDFDPHNFQSYFNHLQVVGLGGPMHLRKDSVDIKNHNENISINNSLLKRPTHNKDQSSKDTKETGITGFSGSTESNVNINQNKNRKNSLRQSCSVINQVPQDEKLAMLRSISINEIEKNSKNTLESKDEKKAIESQTFKKIESQTENDIQIVDVKENQQESNNNNNNLSNEPVIECKVQSDRKNINNNYSANELKDEKLVEPDNKDDFKNVQIPNINKKPIEGKALNKKNNKACCIVF